MQNGDYVSNKNVENGGIWVWDPCFLKLGILGSEPWVGVRWATWTCGCLGDDEVALPTGQGAP